MILIDLQIRLTKTYFEALLFFLITVLNGFNLSNRKFTVHLENSFSKDSSMSYVVPQESILGPLLFLIYVNDMPMAFKCNLFLHVDDTCLVFQSKNIKRISKSS